VAVRSAGGTGDRGLVATELELEGLDRKAAGTLLGRPPGTNVAPHVQEQLLALAEGNPLASRGACPLSDDELAAPSR